MLSLAKYYNISLVERDRPCYEGVIDCVRESVLGVLIDVEEDELHERSSTSEDVVEQPDSTRSNALRVELSGDVVTHPQEVCVEYHEEYVQKKNTNYKQCKS